MRPSADDVQHQALQGILEAFELAWQNGTPTSIESLLDDRRVPRGELLRELVHTELEYRCKVGEEARVEEYFRRFPELADDPAQAVELIAAEYHHRRPRGAKPGVEEFIARFPRHREALLQALKSDEHETEWAGAAAPAPHDLPKRLGRYRIEEEIARGGMGRVVRVWDEQFDRPLALKVLVLPDAEKLSAPERAELEQRFEREAQLTGQMQHPGIPPVQDRGRFDDGRPYFIMKLVKGRSLNDWLRDRADNDADLPRLIDIFQSICDTVAYAHSRGILHRDLKPGNIMVGAFGEVQVMDWGLAKLLSASDAKLPPAMAETPRTVFKISSHFSSEDTTPGSILGTPAYLAPEQARGEVEELDARCDVFGLGGILCTILTRKPPFAAGSSIENHRLSMKGDLRDAFARLARCGADAELIRLAEQCLSPDQADRPADAAAVAAAIRNYQAAVKDRLRQAEIQRAQAEVRTQEEQKRASTERQKRQTLMALAGCVLLFVVIAGAAAFWHQHQSATRALAMVAQVDKNLATAATLRDQERGLPYDEKTKRDEAAALWAKILTLVEQVEGELRSDDLDDVTRKRGADLVEDLRRQAADAEKDRRMRERLEEIRYLRADPRDEDILRAGPRATIVIGKQGDAAHREAFKEFGIDIAALSVDEAAAALRKRRIAGALAASLDDWYMLRDDKAASKLLEIARIADPDPTRNRIRTALLKSDGKDLEALALEAPKISLPAQSLLLLGEALSKDRPDQAEGILRLAQQRYPGDFWTNYSLGAFLTAMKPPDYDGAARFLSSASAVRPGTGFAVASLSAALMQRERYDEGLAVLLESKVSRRDAVTLLATARAYSTVGRRDEAANVCAELLQSRNDSAVVHSQIGRVFASLGDADKALTAHREAIRLQPTAWYVHAIHGWTLMEQGDFDAAANAFRTALRHGPEDADSLIGLGIILTTSPASYKEGLAMLRKATEQHPWNDSAWSFLATKLNDNGDLAAALEARRKAVHLRPWSASYQYLLAHQLFLSGSHEAAKLQCWKAIELRPEQANYHGFLSQILALDNDPSGAKAADAKARQLYAKDAERAKLEWEQRQTKLGPQHRWTLAAARQFGNACNSAGRHTESLKLLEATLAVQKEKLGDADPDTIEAMAALAHARFGAKRYAEAIALFNAILKQRKAKFGQPDPLTLMQLIGEASALDGQFPEAMRILRETLTQRRATLGDDHAATLRTVEYLGFAHLHAGQIDEGVGFREEVLKRRQAKLGRQHYDTLRSMTDLAFAYAKANRVADAVALYEENLILHKGKLGDRHPGTLAAHESFISTCLKFAHDFEQADRLADAVPLLEKAQKLQTETLGSKHRDTLGTANQLLATYRALALEHHQGGRLAAAAPLLERGMKLALETLGADHAETLAFTNILAQVYDDLDRFAKSEGLYRTLLEEYRKKFGRDDVKTAGMLAALSLSMQNQDKHAAAEPLLRECLAIREKQQPDAWTTFNVKAQLGRALVAQKEYAKAEPLLLAGFNGMKERYDKIPPLARSRVVEAAASLVELYEALKQSDKAAQWRKKRDEERKSVKVQKS